MPHSMKTSAKLLLLAAISAMILVVLGGAGIYGMHKMTADVLGDLQAAKTENAALVAVENAHAHFKIQVQEWKDTLLRGNDPANFDKYQAQFSAEEQNVRNDLDTAASRMKELGVATDDVEQLKADHLALGTKYREALAHFDKSDPNAGRVVDKLVKGIDRPAGAGMEKLVIASERRFAERIATQIEHTENSYAAARNVFILLTLVGVAAVLFLSLAVRHDMMNRLGGEPAYAADIARRIADGDLAVNIRTESGDGTSLLAAMKQMQTSLREIIGQIHRATGQLAQDAEQLAVSSQQVSAGSGQQSEAAASMAASIEEITVSINQVAGSAEDARGMATNAGTLSETGKDIVQNAVAEINKIADTVSRSTQQIQMLGEQSDRISAIANVIKEIADQTNLLALNAAIEAARAGEQGRGFAVVADEVRKLAERTGKSTQEISTMIDAIQVGTQQAVQAMAEGRSQVGEGVRMAAMAGDSMIHIETGTRDVLGAVADISAALREQSASSGQIARNVEKIAQMTEENDAAVKEVARAAGHLETLAETLKTSVERFRL